MQSTSLNVSAQSGAASWDSGWIPVAAVGFRVASIQIAWAAVADTEGTLSIEGSDDQDSAKTATVLTVDKAHGVYPDVGEDAGNCLVILADCPGWIRVKYTRTAGGGANQFTVSATLTE